MKSNLRNKIACNVWNLMDDLDIDLFISHLPGKFNQDADLAYKLQDQMVFTQKVFQINLQTLFIHSFY